jgi:SAM-dependent methyltransferase
LIFKEKDGGLRYCPLNQLRLSDFISFSLFPPGDGYPRASIKQLPLRIRAGQGMNDSSKNGTCLLCGNPLPIPMFHARDLLSDSSITYPVSKCGTCGLILTSLPDRRAPSRYPAGYHSRIELQRGPRFQVAGKAFEERLRSIHRFKTHGRILDVGCGDGSFLRALCAAGWEACGTELNAAALCSLRSQGLEVRGGRLPDLKLPSDHFDVITYFGSFEHVESPLEELAEVKRIMKQNGCLLLNLTNAGSLEARLLGSRWFGFEVPRHCFNYTLSTLRLLLASTGLVCLRVDMQHNDFITSFSLACRLGLESHYSFVGRPLSGLLKPIRCMIRLFGQGNVLEVVASYGEVIDSVSNGFEADATG